MSNCVPYAWRSCCQSAAYKKMLSTNWSVIVEVVLDMIESMDIWCMLHGTWRCWFRWQPMRPPPKSPSLWGTKTHLQSANGCGVFRSDFHKVPFRKKDISGNTSNNEIHSGCGAGVASNVILTVSYVSRLLELRATITSAPQTSRAPQLVSENMPAVGMSNPCSTCSKSSQLHWRLHCWRCLWTDI